MQACMIKHKTAAGILLQVEKSAPMDCDAEQSMRCMVLQTFDTFAMKARSRSRCAGTGLMQVSCRRMNALAPRLALLEGLYGAYSFAARVAIYACNALLIS